MRKGAAVAALLFIAGCVGAHDSIVVGSKNFTESILLGEIVAQQLENAGIPVERKLNLGGTFINHEAMKAGQLDVYVEYTGTAYSAVLQLPTISDPDQVQAVVDSAYRENWDMVWTPELGFNNTFAILIRGDVARELGITTVSEAVQFAADWTAGFGHEFLNRADGYAGFVERYGLEFEEPPVSMDLGLIYRALAGGDIDLTAGNSTDGQIRALDLFHLDDDRSYFPPYHAAPLVRAEALETFPELAGILGALGGKIDEAAMAEMNYQVDVERRTPREVAAEFLETISRTTVPSP